MEINNDGIEQKPCKHSLSVVLDTDNETIEGRSKGSITEVTDRFYLSIDESEKLQAMYAAMSDAEFSYAYLSGQSFSDVLMGPDNGSGVMPTDYPTSEGILVSDLNADAQAKVKEVMLAWINDYSEDVAAPLEAAYLSVEALAQTYVAWAGDETTGIDVDTDGTYMRIDGPRFWLEIICQNGVVIQNETHYHTIFRDKAMDYGNSL